MANKGLTKKNENFRLVQKILIDDVYLLIEVLNTRYKLSTEKKKLF